MRTEQSQGRSSSSGALGAGPSAPAPEPFSLRRYYATSLVAGARLLPRPGGQRTALARLVNPLSFPRPAEFRQALHELAPPLRQGRVLDVGSPKLPVAVLALERPGLELYATDILDSFIRPTRQLLEALGLGERIGRTVHLRTEDARRLSFPDAHFDWAYSVSVLEHVAGTEQGEAGEELGDSLAVREIARVLRPGGVLTLTVPYDARVYREECLPGRVYERGGARGEPTFYQRFYDDEALQSRIIAPSGLRCEGTVMLGEPARVKVEPWWNRIPLLLKAPLLPLQGIAGAALFRALPNGGKAKASGVALRLVKD
jgi:SAM-dependent methyltransferase